MAAANEDTQAKPAKKTVKPKKHHPAPATATPKNPTLSSDDVEKPKVVKAKGSKNVHSGVAHVLSTFNNTIVTITDMKGNVIGGRAPVKWALKVRAKALLTRRRWLRKTRPGRRWATG